ncbi:MAG: ComEC/Rec2 family competence protein [bacterium]
MKSSIIFLLLNVSLIAGIAGARWIPVNLLKMDLAWFSMILGCGLLTFLLWNKKKIRITALIGCFLFIGIWRVSLDLPQDSADKIWHYNGQEVGLIGIVAKEPDIRQDKVQLTIKAEKLNDLDLHGLVLASVNLYPQYNYGDRIYLLCDLKAPERFDDFAYDQYLARYQIYSVCYYPETKLLKTGQNNIYAKLLSIKQKISKKIRSNLSQAEASLANAMLLGYKKEITEEWHLKFSQTGLSHLVAISGLHISIIGLLLLQLLLLLGFSRRHVFYITSIILWLYIILIGAPASAVRAGIMGWLVLLAVHLGRLNKSINALILAAAVMLLINPRIFWADIGFQLSFAAVLGIIYLYPVIKKIIRIKVRFVSDIIAISLAAQLATWPLVAYHFSQISLIAPLANLLVIWLLPVIIILIILALILPSAVVFWAPAWLCLHYILLIAEWLSKIPGSSMLVK